MENILKIAYRRMARQLERLAGRQSVDEVLEFVRASELAPKGSRTDLGLGRVLIVAPKYDYGRPSNGYGIEETYFVDSFRQCGCSVLRFDSIGICEEFGSEFTQELLLELVYRENPDLVFCVLFDKEIESSTLLSIRDELRVPVVNWFCDDHWRFESLAARIAPSLTAAITTHHATLPRYASELSAKAVLSQWACNDSLYRPTAHQGRNIDVLFVGQLYGARKRYLEDLNRDGISITTFGNNTPGGRVSQRKLASLLSSAKIVLNFSAGYDGRTNQIKARVFEATGSGCCLITERADNLENYFQVEREYFQFESYSELKQMLRMLKTDSVRRNRVATAAYDRTVAEHLYFHRLKEISEVLGWARSM
jgi:spore maturation protein CgeB